MENSMKQEWIADALLAVLHEVLPEAVWEAHSDDLKAAIEAKVQALAEVHPDLLGQLNAEDVDRIGDALDFHYDMTEKFEANAANKLLVTKIRSLGSEASQGDLS